MHGVGRLEEVAGMAKARVGAEAEATTTGATRAARLLGPIGHLGSGGTLTR